MDATKVMEVPVAANSKKNTQQLIDPPFKIRDEYRGRCLVRMPDNKAEDSETMSTSYDCVSTDCIIAPDNNVQEVQNIEEYSDKNSVAMEVYKNDLSQSNANSPKVISANGGHITVLPNYLQQPMNPLQPIEAAGVSLSQAQSINYNMFRSSIRLNEYFSKKNIDYIYAQAQKSLNAQSTSPSIMLGDGANSGSGNMTGGRATMDEWVRRFIIENLLMRERTNGRAKQIIWCKNTDLARHEPIEEATLRDMMEEFAYGQIPMDADIPSKILERMWRALMRKIPILENSGYKVISSNQVAFLNGYYDLFTRTFHPYTNEPIFNRFSLPFNYEENPAPPMVYNAIKRDMFKGDEELCELADEIAGSILSAFPNNREIYVFQGVKRAGKTFFSEIICRLLGNDDDIIVVSNISDITDKTISQQGKQCRLLYFKDAASKKITKNQESRFKAFAGGERSINHSVTFKMLICTNHPLYTDDNTFLGDSLGDRFVVLPFASKMEKCFNDFDDVDFPRERAGIVKQVLDAFSRALQNGKPHFHQYGINQCVEVSSALPAQMTQDESSRLQEVLAHTSIPEHSDQIIDGLFQLTEKVNPGMTAPTVMEVLNKVCPGLVRTVNRVGNILKDHYGDRLLSDRIAGFVCYNLEFVSNQDQE